MPLHRAIDRIEQRKMKQYYRRTTQLLHRRPVDLSAIPGLVESIRKVTTHSGQGLSRPREWKTNFAGGNSFSISISGKTGAMGNGRSQEWTANSMVGRIFQRDNSR
jgi:hypothetical protein